MEFHQLFRMMMSYEKSTQKNDPQSMDVNENGGVQTLGDQSARVVAQHYGCEDLEKCDPPLDEQLLKKVAAWAFPQNLKILKSLASFSCRSKGKYRFDVEWEVGENIVAKNKVRKMWQVGFMTTTYIVKPLDRVPHTSENDLEMSRESVRDIRVSLTFEKQEITSSFCSDCKENSWCSHIIAAVIYRMNHPEKVPVHAPVTEILSTLNRDQLQKLLQYAIYDDPAGVLGKVFKFVDVIRDTNSEEYKEKGAPDPTFGGIQGSHTQWENTKKDFKTKLHYYIKKEDSMDNISVLDNIVVLQKHGKYSAAADLIIMFLDTLIEKVKYNMRNDRESCTTRDDNEALERTCHTLTLLMLNPHIDKKTYQCLLNFIEEVTRKPKCPSNSDCRWRQLPSISLCFPQLKKQYRNVLAGPISTKRVDPWSAELFSLINGDVNVHNTTYDEHVVIMMARLESLFLISDKMDLHKVLRFLQLILRKLAKIALKYSILSGKLHESKICEIFDITNVDNSVKHAFHCMMGNQSTRCGADENYQRKPVLLGSSGKTYAAKVKNPAKKQKIQHKTEEAELSKDQFTFALFHCIWLQEFCEQVCEQKIMDNKATVAYCWLALESSRFWAFDKTADSSQFHELKLYKEKIIMILKDKMSKSDKYAQEPALIICHTLGEKKFKLEDFYQKQPPILLVDAMVEMAEDETSLAVQNKSLLEMCFGILFLLPKISLNLEDYYRHSADMAKVFAHILDVFLKVCLRAIDDRNCNKSELLTNEDIAIMLHQVILKLGMVKDKDVMTELVPFIIKRATLLDAFPVLSFATMTFLCHAITTVRAGFVRSPKVEVDIFQMILATVNVYHLPCLTAITATDANLTATELVKILDVLKPVIQAKQKADECVIEVMHLCLSKPMNYIKNNEHTKMTLVSIFDLLDCSTDHYRELMKAVIYNANHIHHHILYQLAQRHYARICHDNIFDDTTLDLVDCALKTVECDHEDAMDIVKWTFEKCNSTLQQNNRHGRQVFTKFAEIIAKCYNQPDGILLVIERSKELPSSLVKTFPCFGTALIKGYGSKISSIITKCNTNEYDDIIKTLSMWRAEVKRLFSSKYVEQYDKHVFQICSRFSTKKKLMRMIETLKSEFAQDSKIKYSI